jgi:hypothetical protein
MQIYLSCWYVYKDAKKQAALKRELPIWRAMQALKLVDEVAPNRPLKVGDLKRLWKAKAKYKPPTSAKRREAYIKQSLGGLGVADNTPEIDLDSVVVTPTPAQATPSIPQATPTPAQAAPNIEEPTPVQERKQPVVMPSQISLLNQMISMNTPFLNPTPPRSTSTLTS